MKKSILIITLLLLLCSCNKFKVTGFKEAIESSEQTLSNLSKDGYLEDNIYYYPILNFKFNIPSDLRLLKNKEINMLVYGTSEQPIDTDNIVIYEFYAINMDDNSVISLVSDTPSRDYSIDEYVDIFYNLANDNSDDQNTTVYEPENCDICGKSFIKIRSIIKSTGRYLDTYITKVDDKFVSIQMMCNSEKEISEFLTIIEPFE